jgi:hypothetical protein
VLTQCSSTLSPRGVDVLLQMEMAPIQQRSLAGTVKVRKRNLKGKEKYKHFKEEKENK